MLIQDNPGLEHVRFCTSGTEATMYATRLARAFTGKKKVVKAKFGWHGYGDPLLYNVKAPLTGRETRGIFSSKKAQILSIDINNPNVSEVIKRHSKELAAVIVEPVLGGGGGFPVDPDFLLMLREVTEQYDILLIFDEVITGYRFNYGLFQNDLKIIDEIECDWGSHSVIQCPKCEELFSIDKKCPAFQTIELLLKINPGLFLNNEESNYLKDSHPV